MHIHTLIQPDGLDFVRDKGKVVFVEQAHSPDKDPRGFWSEAIRTTDNTIHQPHHPGVVPGSEPVFSIQGGRVYATFPLVSEEKIMSRHCYCLVDADGTILRVTEPLEKAPPPEERYGVRMIWQQVPDDAPAHNPDLHECHSPKFVLRGHRVHREFQIRRKAGARARHPKINSTRPEDYFFSSAAAICSIGSDATRVSSPAGVDSDQQVLIQPQVGVHIQQVPQPQPPQPPQPLQPQPKQRLKNAHLQCT